MADQDAKNTPPTDGGEPKTDVDTSKYVPKEEFEKISTSLKSKDDSIAKLQRDLASVQEKLLSDDYLQYLNSKKDTRGNQTQQKGDGPLPEGVANRINMLEQSVNNLAAIMELQDVERRHADFGEYREDIESLIRNPNNNLTFEQAYIIAKQGKAPAAPKAEDKPAEPPKGSEKPGAYVPDPAHEAKAFKGVDDATQDALQQIREKYSLRGDIL